MATDASRAVWFPQWPDALRQLHLPSLRQKQYQLALIRYLKFCKETRQQATVASAREFMAHIHEECRRLFAALDGASHLMAELMYGSG